VSPSEKVGTPFPAFPLHYTPGRSGMAVIPDWQGMGPAKLRRNFVAWRSLSMLILLNTSIVSQYEDSRYETKTKTLRCYLETVWIPRYVSTHRIINSGLISTPTFKITFESLPDGHRTISRSRFISCDPTTNTACDLLCSSTRRRIMRCFINEHRAAAAVVWGITPGQFRRILREPGRALLLQPMLRWLRVFTRLNDARSARRPW